ncbi:dTDP-D-glucose 4,6-dehydratase [Penicillium alfredii]|uniref:dTDP-D-glucose 4,6-dehydratase n=1 Tax=Penicillium alfredii TaxID=1506179 RepID=A0A9W9F015_9EURO|nr:dTDP-D-glucose 4,6-dehydratase [Penicillium alfredii]KAJ5091100.1 dTDP-D-glucose 4,6-dehydratase [Penicillium alfredii]
MNMAALSEPKLVPLTGTTQFEALPNIANILVTGGAGFIGSWVTRHLVIRYPEKYRVVCFDRMDTAASFNNLMCLSTAPNFDFIHGDITDLERVRYALEFYEIDCVLHFAASSHVQISFSKPFDFTRNNVVGTHIVLEAVRIYGKVGRFIHVSTDEIYGETNGTKTNEAKVDENGNFFPTNPYSASKAAADMYAMAYLRSFRLPIIIVRSNNVYGPCQYPEKIIPTFIKLLMEGKKLPIQGDGSHTRCFLYGSDAADAFDTILHKGNIGEVYNIESDYEVRNSEVAANILSLFGYDPVYDFESHVKWVPDRPFNDMRYNVDGSKLKRLGWMQQVDFSSGLALTVSWYKQNLRWWWKTPSSISTNLACQG